MSTVIIHLEVGDSNFVPTGEQLQEIVAEFTTKAIPAYSHKIKSSEVFINPDHSRLMIQAGTDDWEPTREELNALVSQFEAALIAPKGAVVATRAGVKLKLVPALPKEA